MYYYDVDRLNVIREKLNYIYGKYKDGFDELNEEAEKRTAEKSIWCGNWVDPYSRDYITEIFDNTTEQRKILKRKPADRTDKSLHMYENGVPVVSEYYGEKGGLTLKKFNIPQDGGMTGISYDLRQKQIYDITVEIINENSECDELYHMLILNGVTEICARKYYYENGCITGAAAIDKYDIDKQILLYDDPMYDNMGRILSPGQLPMNPSDVCDYEFIYGDDGYPEAFTRKNYSYGKEVTHTWKIRKGIMKRYVEYGISCFLRK